MSTDVTIFNNTDIAAVKQRKGALGDVFQAPAPKPTGSRIQATNTGKFKKIVNGQEAPKQVADEINVIIVGALPKVSREYYEGDYDENNKSLPTCWSNLGDKPEAGSTSPQHAACATCPQNIKGSGAGDRKACKYQRRLAIMLPGDPEKNIYQMKIPGGSLFDKGAANAFGFEAYIKYIVGNGFSPDTVVTKIFHDPNNKGQTYVLKFSAERPLTDEEYNAVVEAQSNPDVERYTKISVAETDGVGSTGEIEFASAPPADEPVEEPVKRSSKKAAEPKPEGKSSLAAVIDEWN